MPHLHLSVQAGSDLILKRMKRRHLRGDILAVAKRARDLRPGLSLGADVIAGFPTETDALFEETRALVEEVGFAFLHVFPYSEREGTPAARMPAVAKDVRRARAARLRETGSVSAREFRAGLIGRELAVLTETENAGHCAHFVPVKLAAPVGANRILRARAVGVTDDGLLAEAS